jgi:hypothetical protein
MFVIFSNTIDPSLTSKRLKVDQNLKYRTYRVFQNNIIRNIADYLI